MIKTNNIFKLRKYLQDFTLAEESDFFNPNSQHQTQIEFLNYNQQSYPKFINEFWTSRQRQATALHEISYRACFKPQLPHFFIRLLTESGEVVYDPFAGRGTTVLEAALLNRNIIANDINPISRILYAARLQVPKLSKLEQRLAEIPFEKTASANIDLSMFFHPDTEAEIVSLKNYLAERQQNGKEDLLDRWLRMIATNRLTGHSTGFFSVYSLPPNQAISPQSQRKINIKRNQQPEYRNTRALILKKSKSLLKNLFPATIQQLNEIGQRALFLTQDARFTDKIADQSVRLTVTSPPFLNVVQYANDNWLRCWFNGIQSEEVAHQLTMAKSLEEWLQVMAQVFTELYRITQKDGWLAFEVGEVRRGKIKLEEEIVPLGLQARFECVAILINQQTFTKTANIWGVANNAKGTNTNRIVIFRK